MMPAGVSLPPADCASASASRAMRVLMLPLCSNTANLFSSDSGTKTRPSRMAAPRSLTAQPATAAACGPLSPLRNAESCSSRTINCASLSEMPSALRRTASVLCSALSGTSSLGAAFGVVAFG